MNIIKSIKKVFAPIEVSDRKDLIRKVNAQLSSGYAGVAAKGAVNYVKETSNSKANVSAKPWIGDFDEFMSNSENHLVFK